MAKRNIFNELKQCLQEMKDAKRIAKLETENQRWREAVRQVLQRYDNTGGVVLSKDIGKLRSLMEDER